jgi:hypothetical protein
MKIRDIVQFGLRIPPDLKEQIRASASDSGNSMNNEMIERLRASYEPPSDLSGVSTGDLVKELINRNKPGKISIEISGHDEKQ